VRQVRRVDLGFSPGGSSTFSADPCTYAARRISWIFDKGLGLGRRGQIQNLPGDFQSGRPGAGPRSGIGTSVDTTSIAPTAQVYNFATARRLIVVIIFPV